MASPELVEWIKSQIEEGHSEDDIKAVLVSQGWSQDEISEAITEAGPAEKPKPEKTEHVSRFIGAGLALAAGLLVLYKFLNIGIAPFFVIDEIFSILLGVLLIIGAGLLWADKARLGAILVIIFSIVYFIITGQIVALIIGIVGGIVGFKRR